MAAVVPFAFEDSLVRAVWREGDPWFVAKDICGVLGLTNSRMALQPLDEDEKGVSSTDTPGGRQEVAVVSEGGLYTLILRCRDATKPGTVPHRFRRWVTGEVLPSLRRTGGYAMPGVDPGTAADADIRLQEHQREMVAEARRVWGTAAARKLWLGYGLPDLTALPAETAEDLERAFLADVLARRLESIAEAYETWTGTAAQLLALIERDAGPHDRSNTRWPTNAQALGSAIARVKPLLAHRGIRIERRHSGIRTITLALVEA